MCGRFTMRQPGIEVARFHLTKAVAEERPRYNAAPGQSLLVIREVAGRREVAHLDWGLLPSWAAEPNAGARPINARSETAAEKPTFRAALAERRCLVPADGFFEWNKNKASKTAYHVGVKPPHAFAFAGIWERWSRPDRTIESFAILTTAANDLLNPIHDRMPVMLRPDDYDAWLDPTVSDPKQLTRFFEPYPADRMVLTPVGTWVNDVRHDEPRCLEPPAPQEETGSLF